MERHEFVHIKIGEQEADIDKELSPIIEVLWNKGIKTIACCQEINPGFANIVFENATEAIKFVKLFFTKVELEKTFGRQKPFWMQDFYNKDNMLYLDEDFDKILAEATEKYGGLFPEELQNRALIILDPFKLGVLGWNKWEWTCAFILESGDFVIHCKFPKEEIAEMARRLC